MLETGARASSRTTSAIVQMTLGLLGSSRRSERQRRDLNIRDTRHCIQLALGRRFFLSLTGRSVECTCFCQHPATMIMSMMCRRYRHRTQGPRSSRTLIDSFAQVFGDYNQRESPRLSQQLHSLRIYS
jgi:hypothetical protein